VSGPESESDVTQCAPVAGAARAGGEGEMTLDTYGRDRAGARPLTP
jgi:hypothetical protein